MKIKILVWALVLSGILIIVLAVMAFLKPAKEDIDVEIPAQTISTILSEIKTTQKIIKDIKFPTKYIIKTETDTIEITPDTPYRDIPITETSWQDKFSLTIDNKLEFIYFKEAVTHRGEILKRDIFLQPTTFRISLQKPSPIKFYGNIGVGYMNKGCVPVMAEFGIKAKKRYSLSGVILRTEKTYYGGMFKIWF